MNRPAKRTSKTTKRKSAPKTKGQADSGERLQKVLAGAGHGSRRACEELIVAGRVEVDGKVTDVLGTRVDPAKQDIRVDGVSLPKKKLRYYLLNKPTGVVSTNRDPSGRPRVIDLVPGDQQLFPVGRLDISSEGLILVTNDGDLANELAHPRYGVEKIYEVEVAGKPEADQIRKLQTGIYLAEAFVKVESVRIKKQKPNSALLEITLREGRNREIRRILARVGHKVLRLKRIAIGPLRLAKLPTGAYRELSPAEVTKLRGKQPVKRVKKVRGKPDTNTPSAERKTYIKKKTAKKPTSRSNDGKKQPRNTRKTRK